jgi:hypothetical protein
MSNFKKLSRAELKNVTGGYENPACRIDCSGSGYLGFIYTANCTNMVEQCRGIYAWRDIATSATCSCNPAQ